MALIKCSECEKEVSSNATNCPDCGNPISKQVAKQIKEEKKAKNKRTNLKILKFGCLPIFGLFFIFVMIGAIFGESKPDNQTKVASNSTPKSQTTQETPTTQSTTTETPKPVAKPAPKPQPQEIISGITWREIDKIYNIQSKYTDLQKKELWKKYKGKRVKWHGKVSSISEGFFGGLNLQVKMNRNTFTSDLLIELDDSQKDKALTLSENSSITFSGILSDWGSILPITIDDGKILD